MKHEYNLNNFLNCVGQLCRLNYTETDDDSDLRDVCTIIGRIIYCNRNGVVIEPIVAEEKPFMILYKNIIGVFITKSIPHEEVVIMTKDWSDITTDKVIYGINDRITFLSRKDPTMYLELTSDVTHILIPSNDITKIFLKDKENIMYQTKRINDTLDFLVGKKVIVEYKDESLSLINNDTKEEKTYVVCGIFDHYEITDTSANDGSENIHIILVDDNGININILRHRIYSISEYTEYHTINPVDKKKETSIVRSFTVRENKASLVPNIGSDLNDKLEFLQRDGWEILDVAYTKCREYNYDDGNFESLVFVIIAKKEGIEDVE